MLDILDTLLAPFARLMVARGIAFPDLAERLKAHYVEAARAQAEGKPTDSRLSVMTGLQRRDVARLRGFATKPERPNHLARLVALWQTEELYAPDGGPSPLPKSGPAPSFEELAREVRRDVHPRTMLDALVDAGTVVIDPDTQEVTLVEASYQPLSGSEDQLAYLAANMGDHLQAATENVRGCEPRHFERAVHYTHLSPDQINVLATEFHAGQMALLKKLSQSAAEMKQQAGPDATHRFRAGGYFYRTEANTE